jgi:hypothetical protein
MPHTTWLEQFSGGNTHRHLCALAVEVMESRGVSKWRGEAGYPGGVSDVIASDKSIVAECGNNTVHKIVPALQAGMTFVALPYSYHLTDEYHLAGAAGVDFAIVFEPTDNPVPTKALHCGACGRVVMFSGSARTLAVRDQSGHLRYEPAGHSCWLPEEHLAPCGLQCIRTMLEWTSARPVWDWHHPLWCRNCPPDTSRGDIPGVQYLCMIGCLAYNVLNPFPNGDPAKSRASSKDIWENHAGRVLFKKSPVK